MAQIDEILTHMKELDASDIHLVTGAPVTFRIHGDLVPANDRALAAAEVELLLYVRANEHGRVAAYEIMINTPAIGNMIREGKTYQIPTSIQTGRREGMQLLEQHLAQLAEEGVITSESAMAASSNPSIALSSSGGVRIPEPVA